jgi:hypothetical protein
MKKLLCIFFLLCVAGSLWAGAAKKEDASTTVSVAEQTTSPKVIEQAEELSPAERKKQAKERRKQIKKLVKEYRKASSEEKPVIKAKLAGIVSVAVDNGLNYMKERIAAERQNLDNWEAKVQEQESHLDEVKALRVEDLLSGTAEKKHKAAKKAWKKQIKEAKKKVK